MLLKLVIHNGTKGHGYDGIGNRYIEISPRHSVKKRAPPTILFFCTKDQHILVTVINKFKAKMEAVGNRCDLHLYEGQTHGFSNIRR